MTTTPPPPMNSWDEPGPIEPRPIEPRPSTANFAIVLFIVAGCVLSFIFW